MPKRKRSTEEELENKYAYHKTEICRALKAAKGFERQRMAKRIHDAKSTPDKVTRINREVNVLKSLDLHQTAHTHLCSSLLKIKAVADLPTLPDEIRNGVPKVDLSEAEKAALHNVTSALYNQPKVRGALAKGVADICEFLGVAAPAKKERVRKGDLKDNAEDPKAAESAITSKAKSSRESRKEEASKYRALLGAESQEAAVSKRHKNLPGVEETEVASDEEDAVDQYADLLGASSESSDDEEPQSDDDDDDGDEDDEDDELDPMEISDLDDASAGSDDEVSLSDADEEGDLLNDADAPLLDDESDSEDENSIPRPKPLAKPVKKGPKAKPAPPAVATSSLFLPGLSGGYISGSESASDVDVAPAIRKNRRGQKARQAIWEKKHGAGAKHLLNVQKNAQANSGWDAKRGAVDSDGRRGPWKPGVRNPFEKRDAPEGRMSRGRADRIGPAGGSRQPVEALHPSWEARKKAKEMQENATYQGKKMTFD